MKVGRWWCGGDDGSGVQTGKVKVHKEAEESNYALHCFARVDVDVFVLCKLKTKKKHHKFSVSMAKRRIKNKYPQRLADSERSALLCVSSIIALTHSK